jgi:hypothetical protein
MDQHEKNTRRVRREWLLRLCNQSLQRQQVGRSRPSLQAVQGSGTWRPAPGWVGQHSPESVLTFDDEPVLDFSNA